MFGGLLHNTPRLLGIRALSYKPYYCWNSNFVETSSYWILKNISSLVPTASRNFKFFSCNLTMPHSKCYKGLLDFLSCQITLRESQDKCVKLIRRGFNQLTHFNPIFHFYTPWKRQKTKGFLTFLRGIKMEHWAKMN